VSGATWPYQPADWRGARAVLVIAASRLDPRIPLAEMLMIDTVIALVPDARFLAPLHQSVVDKPSAWRAVRTIGEAARQHGLRVREEGRFATRRDVEVRGLFAIEPDTNDLEPPT
jgi:hypothetical protein